MRLYLDNILISKDDYTTSDFTLQKDSTEERDITQDFDFFGVARQIIFDQIIDNPNGLIATIPMIIIDDCCSDEVLFFEGEIRGDDISFCDDDCFVSCKAYQKDSANKVMDCLESLAIENIDKINNQKNQLVGYCNEARPQFVHDMIMILGSLGILIMAIIGPVVNIVAAIIDAIGSLFSGRPINVQDELRLGKTIRDEIRKFIVPCKYQPTPYVRDIIQGACEQCGAYFSSTVFNSVGSEYYNTLYFAAQSEEGFDKESQYNEGLIAGNIPVKSVYEFLQDFKEINIDFKVKKINGIDTLFVERKDFFDATEILQLPNDSKTCYTSNFDVPEAFAIVEFRQDGFDLVGGESKNTWYKKLFEWNLPVSEIQKGSLRYQINFAMHRQIGDKIRRTVYEAYQGIFSSIFSLNLKKYKEWLLLHNGLAFVPKLLVWNPNRKLIKDFNKSWHAETLYNNFLYIDNPRLTGYARWEATVEFDRTCENYNTWLNAVDKSVQTSRGIMKDISITINASTKKITLKGKVI